MHHVLRHEVPLVLQPTPTPKLNFAPLSWKSKGHGDNPFPYSSSRDDLTFGKTCALLKYRQHICMFNISCL